MKICVQELVTNTLRHSGATQIEVQVFRKNNLLNLFYSDNGKGFDSEISKSSPGIGLRTIQARVTEMNGTFAIDSGKGNGTSFIIDIPC